MGNRVRTIRVRMMDRRADSTAPTPVSLGSLPVRRGELFTPLPFPLVLHTGFTTVRRLSVGMAKAEPEVERVAVVPLEDIESMDDQCVIYVDEDVDARCQNEATHVEVVQFGESRQALPICSEHE